MPTKFNSTVKLYHIPEITAGHFPVFSSVANQTTFFNNRKIAEIPNCKIIKDQGIIKVNVDKDLYNQVNYISFINPDFRNRCVYGYVSSPPKYVNNKLAIISYSEDPLQTYLDQILDGTIHCIGEDTVIDREHASQQHHTAAESNPYNSDLWELDTAETLPVNTDLETYDYNFYSYADNGATDPSFIADYDACKLFPEAVTLSYQNYIHIIWVAQIDFDDLDAEDASHPARTKWDEFLTNAGNYDYGFAIGFDGLVKSISNKYNNLTTSNAGLINYYNSTCAILALPSSADTQSEYNIDNLIMYLTKWGCVSQIVNLVVTPSGILKGAFKNKTSLGALDNLELNVPQLDVRNKKLMRYPYSYIRLITPAGDKKELRYEYFRDVRLGGDTFKMAICTDIVSGITLIAAPVKYRYNLTSSMVESGYVDSENMIKFSQIPTAPYNIDSFLAQMSAVAQERCRNNTIIAQQNRIADNAQLMLQNSSEYQALDTAERATAHAQGIAASLATINPAGVLAEGKQIMEEGAERAARQMRGSSFEMENELQQTAGNLLGGDNAAFASAYINYAHTRPAYASADYKAPTGAGFEHFSSYGWLNIALQKVKLRTRILSIYDDFFEAFGYTSGRTGLPFIFSYLTGSSSAAELPHWNEHGETYIKTSTIHIAGGYEYVNKYLEAMFNSGVHFIKGDDIIAQV